MKKSLKALYILCGLLVVSAISYPQQSASNTKIIPPVINLLFEDRSTIILDELKAFPTASGAGMHVTGGRGGKTCFVDTLIDSSNGQYSSNTDSYSGSLRYCLEENPMMTKTVVFLVGGEFKLTEGDIQVNQKEGGNITIAGQTARNLGGVHILQGTYRLFFDNIFNVNLRYVDFKQGIAFVDNSVSINANTVVIDGESYDIITSIITGVKSFNVGSRVYIIDGDTGNIVSQADGLQFSRVYDVIVDHVTTAYHGDESFSLRGFHGVDDGPREDLKNITVQRSLMLPGIKGHNVGSLFGGYAEELSVIHAKNMDIHHNLWVNATHRQPNTGGGPDAKIRIFNNVTYGWHNRTSNLAGDAKVDIFNNYYKKSPATGSSSQRLDRLFRFDFFHDWTNGSLQPNIYLAGNYIEGVIEDLSADNWPAINHHRTSDYGMINTPLSRNFQRNTRLTDATNTINVSDAITAYNDVVNDVGEGVRFDSNGDTYYSSPLAVKFINYVVNGTGPTVIPSSEGWLFPDYPSNSVSRDLFDSDGVPIGWTPPTNVINRAGYSRQELYFAEMAGDFYRLKKTQ